MESLTDESWLLTWSQEIHAALSTGSRFPALLRATTQRYMAAGPTLAQLFRCCSLLFSHDSMESALNLHLHAMLECLAGRARAVASEEDFALLLQFLAELTASPSERGFGIALLIAPLALQVCAGMAQRAQELHQLLQASTARLLSADAQSRLAFLSARVCLQAQVPGALFTEPERLRLLSCTVEEKHWSTVASLLTAFFPKNSPQRDAAFNLALSAAGDGRAASLLASLRRGGSTSGAPPTGDAVSASSVIGVFQQHPFKQHVHTPIHLLPFDPPHHPHLLVNPNRGASSSSSREEGGECPASSLVSIIAQGHKAPSSSEQQQHEAFPPMSSWKQRSLRHLVHGLRDLPLACAFSLGDASCKAFLLHLLHRAGSAAEARAAAAAFGWDEARVARALAECSSLGAVAAPPQLPATATSATSASAPQAHFWDLPMHFVPQQQPTLDDPSSTSSSSSCLSSPPPPGVRLTLVQCAGSYSSMVAELGSLTAEAEAQGATLALGLDTEHRPAHTPPYPLALLQLATPNKCWLVDLLEMHQKSVPAATLGLLGAALAHSAVVCVGWGVREDLRRLARSHCSVLCGEHTPQEQLSISWLDLADLARGLPVATGSLSSLVGAVLGLPLDKGMQVSDWQVRPLSAAQLKYAALDAVSAPCIVERVGRGEALRLARPWLCSAAEGAATAAAAAAAAAFPPHTYTPLLLLQDGTLPPLGPWHCALALQACGLPPLQHLLCRPPGAAGAASVPATMGSQPVLPIKTLAVLCSSSSSSSAQQQLLQPCLLVLPKGRKAAVSWLPLGGAPGEGGEWRLAGVQECVRLFGYTPGSFPPLLGAYRPGLAPRVLVDSAVAGWQGGLVGGGGSPEHAVWYGSTEELLLGLGGSSQVQVCALCGVGEGEGGREEQGAASAAGREGGSGSEGAAACVPVPVALPLPAVVIPSPRLLLDSSLGRLTRWLRVVGVDAENRVGWSSERWLAARRGGGGLPGSSGTATATATATGTATGSGTPEMSTEELVEWANEEHRIVVTRDAKVLAKKVGAYFVAANSTAAQFVDLCDSLAIVVRPGDLMARCAHCNGLGYSELSPQEARQRDTEGLIPEKVLAKVDRFWACLTCPKLYWEGQKFDDTREKYAGMFRTSEGKEGQ